MMWDANETFKMAKYSAFSVSSEADQYRLNIGGYSSSDLWHVGDDFAVHNGYPFSTVDQRNSATFIRGSGGGGVWYVHSFDMFLVKRVYSNSLCQVWQ